VGAVVCVGGGGRVLLGRFHLKRQDGLLLSSAQLRQTGGGRERERERGRERERERERERDTHTHTHTHTNTLEISCNTCADTLTSTLWPPPTQSVHAHPHYTDCA